MKTQLSRDYQSVFGMAQTLLLLLFCGIPFLFAVRLVDAVALIQARGAVWRGCDQDEKKLGAAPI